MAVLKIARDSGYADRARAYQVILDGHKIGEIKNGWTQRFPVTPGQHRIWLKIDWCGSKEITFAIAENDEITLQAKSNLRGFKVMAALWYAIFDRRSYLMLERSS